MRKLQIGDRVLTEKDIFVIAEIGSNFSTRKDETKEDQVAECEWLITEAAKCGAHAVKLQKRNNTAMFTKKALAEPYANERSFGRTYGEHRDHNDWFGVMEFHRFKQTADKYGVLFFATPFEEESALFLNAIGVPIFKIASCDVSNLPLVRYVAAMQKPMIVSTGGATMEEIGLMTDELDKINPNYALLHCVSIYPNLDKHLNLLTIKTLRDKYPDKLIGFSSHHSGLDAIKDAWHAGARIFEVHFTRNRGALGSDHGFSLEPKGLSQLCEDLPRIPIRMGDGIKKVTEMERAGFVSKMGKGIYLAGEKKAGEKIREIDIQIKSPYAGGYQPYQEGEVVGMELAEDCSTGINLKPEMLK